MTDYTVDDVVPVITSIASISHGSSIFGLTPEHQLPRPKIVSYRNCLVASSLASQWHSSEEGLKTTSSSLEHAPYNLPNYLTNREASRDQAKCFVSPSTQMVSWDGVLVHWRASEGYDLSNLAVARSGQGIDTCILGNWMGRLIGGTYPSQVTVLISDEVIDFSYHHHIFGHLQTAVRIARDSFKQLHGLHVTVESDRESDEEWIVLTARVNGDVSDVLDMYDKYTAQTVDAIPWPSRDKIRLIYDII